MKNYLLFAFLMFFGTSMMGQTTFGVGGSYDDFFGVHARAKLDVNDKVNLLPQFTFWFPDNGSSFALEGNLTYDLAVVADMPIYTIGGLNWTRASFMGFSSSLLGLNAGAGIIISSQFYVEPVYYIPLKDNANSSLRFNFGYYF